MIDKSDVTFDVNDGLGANGEEDLGGITVSYYLDVSNEYGDCYLTLRDETNNEEIVTFDDICNFNNFESSSDWINKEIRSEIVDAVNSYLTERGLN